MQHATDADHLVAVATIVTRERRFADGALIGALWGLGHTATLAVAGGLVLALNLAGRVPSAGFELIVAATLVVLGISRLHESLSGMRRASRDHLAARHVGDHDHDGLEVIHSHPHAHDGDVHAHAHVHPSRGLLGALAGRRRLALRPLLVGAVHGMAGSAAVSLLVLSTVRSAWGAVLYLGLFGLGTIVGMTALTAAMAYPLSLALRIERARFALGVAAGLGSVAFGIVCGYRAI